MILEFGFSQWKGILEECKYMQILLIDKVDCAVDYLRDSALSVYKDLENSNVEVTRKLKKAR
jgi:hypothetical protein